MKKLALLLPVAFLALACADRKYTTAVTMFGGDEDPAMTTSPVEGDYLLFLGTSDGAIARTHLHAGDPIGFRRDAVDSTGKPVGAKGSITAVAGEMMFPIAADTPAEWRRIPDSTNESRASNPYMPHP